MNKEIEEYFIGYKEGKEVGYRDGFKTMALITFVSISLAFIFGG